MAYALQVGLELETITCGGCCMTFAIPGPLMRRYREEGISIKCPNPACPWGGMRSGETDNMKLKKELEAAQRRLEFEKNQRLAAEADAAKERRRAVRLEKRAKGGACPCCNRTFAGLARHMKTKHPDFAKVAKP